MLCKPLALPSPMPPSSLSSGSQSSWYFSAKGILFSSEPLQSTCPASPSITGPEAHLLAFSSGHRLCGPSAWGWGWGEWTQSQGPQRLLHSIRALIPQGAPADSTEQDKETPAWASPLNLDSGKETGKYPH